MDPLIILKTDRVVLTPWQTDNWLALHRIASDPEVMRHITGGKAWSDAQTQEFLARQMRHFTERGFCLWKLQLNGDDEAVGLCGIQPLEGTSDIEIGWWLARRHWGEGIATEAARAAMRDAFTRVGLDRLVAIARAENAASLRIMEKLGMKYEREHVHRGIPVVMFGIARADWRRRNEADARRMQE